MTKLEQQTLPDLSLGTTDGTFALPPLTGDSSSCALAINAPAPNPTTHVTTTQIVGYSEGSSGSHAVYWTVSYKVSTTSPYTISNVSVSSAATAITFSGWTLEEATGVNNAGAICGWGTHMSGMTTYTHGFLLTGFF